MMSCIEEAALELKLLSMYNHMRTERGGDGPTPPPLFWDILLWISQKKVYFSQYSPKPHSHSLHLSVRPCVQLWNAGLVLGVNQILCFTKDFRIYSGTLSPSVCMYRLGPTLGLIEGSRSLNGRV